MMRRPPRSTRTYTLFPYTPRLRSTDGEQTVLVEDENGDYQPLTGGKPYENWLPSANIRFQFTPDLFLRLAYSKAITRPDYGNLSPALLLNPISMTASGGNPALVPDRKSTRLNSSH